MRTKEEQIGLLAETVMFYSEDTSLRSVGDDGCYYKNPEGLHCAVGRCMLKSTLENREIEGRTIYSINLDEGGIDRLLKEEYRGYPVGLWNSLQDFHDERANWDAYGLTEEGLTFEEVIVNDINNGVYL